MVVVLSKGPSLLDITRPDCPHPEPCVPPRQWWKPAIPPRSTLKTNAVTNVQVLLRLCLPEASFSGQEWKGRCAFWGCWDSVSHLCLNLSLSLHYWTVVLTSTPVSLQAGEHSRTELMDRSNTHTLTHAHSHTHTHTHKQAYAHSNTVHTHTYTSTHMLNAIHTHTPLCTQTTTLALTLAHTQTTAYSMFHVL